MSAKIFSFIITLIINLILGFIVLLILSISLSDYRNNESDFGINAFVFLAVITSVFTAILSVIACYLFQNRWKKTDFLSLLYSVIIFVFLNGLIDILLFIIATWLVGMKRDGSI
jgi:chromate transport protein ChrA